METNVIEKAQKFAYDRHKNQKKQDGVTLFSTHLEGVVNRLKNLGVTDKEILSAAWLHDVLEHTHTTFDEVNEIFGNKIAVLVLSLSKDMTLSKKEQENQYVHQLKNSNFHTQLIKICDISTNLKELPNAPISKTQKSKKIKKLFHYARILRKDLSENKEQYPKIQEIIDGINSVGQKFRQRPIII
ncbi:MAG: HD domain-containing protein [Nitrosopumilaceae archaeon]|nr:HD domain-containing protein [Nitrosopumilaceae archaeon]